MQLEQLASTHEALVLLLQNLPRPRLIALMCAVAGIEPPEIGEVREHTPTLDVPGNSRRARRRIVDLLLVVHTPDGQISMCWILEAQVCWNDVKRWNWALYPVALAAETHRRSMLAAFVPDPVLRGKIRTKLIPKIDPQPILIERDHIELIVDTDTALRRPHEAILGAVYHSREDEAVERRVAGFRAGFIALQSLDCSQRQRYTVLMLTTAPSSIAQAAFEDMRGRGELDEELAKEITEFERGGYLFHKAHQLGLQEGQKVVLRCALLDMLEARGFTVSPQQHARVQACDDLATLERWYASARTLAAGASPDPLFE